MATKYVSFRLPRDVREMLYNRKKNFDREVSLLTGKPSNIPMTKVLRTILKKSIFIPNEELMKLKKWRKNGL